jgi:hypothetical protein
LIPRRGDVISHASKRGQARLKLKDEMAEAVANCTLALSIEPDSVKALFRRGQVRCVCVNEGWGESMHSSALCRSYLFTFVCRAPARAAFQVSGSVAAPLGLPAGHSCCPRRPYPVRDTTQHDSNLAPEFFSYNVDVEISRHRYLLGMDLIRARRLGWDTGAGRRTCSRGTWARPRQTCWRRRRRTRRTPT